MTEVNNYCNTCPNTIRGICCWFSLYDGVDNFIVYPCKYLSKKTRRCTIYKNRFKINKNCTNIDRAYYAGALPKDCRYVKDYDPNIYPPIRPFKTIHEQKRKELIKKWKLKKTILLNSE